MEWKMTLRDKLKKTKEIARSAKDISLNVLVGSLACVTLFGMCGGGPILYFHLGSKKHFEEENRERWVSCSDGTYKTYKDLNGDGIVEKIVTRPGEYEAVYEGRNDGGPLFYDLQFRLLKVTPVKKS